MRDIDARAFARRSFVERPQVMKTGMNFVEHDRHMGAGGRKAKLSSPG
ncbi:MAG: hypothetical protein JOY76_11950 [Hyphomicrobiales bacterium]|nr:hypothetical protein [Hyphomicrobiales bacterium]